MQKYFKIGEISKLYNIGVDSLRYYEKIGIIKPFRSESGYRYYSINDISRLNVIRDLLELGFDMPKIKTYLDDQTIESSLNILNDEERIIDEKIKHLLKIKYNVSKRIENIESISQIEIDEIKIKHYDKRKCFKINYAYKRGAEMDVLIKTLLNKNPEQLFIMGNNRFGTNLSKAAIINDNEISYQSVFVVDKHGDSFLNAGEYLSIFYRGNYGQSLEYAKKLIAYANEHNLELSDEFHEILWVDIHTSALVEEFITELQIFIKNVTKTDY